MKIFRDRLGVGPARENGLSLIEVMVAMMIFALISTGVIYTLLSMMATGRDTRARQVATNLAAEEVDLARSEDDVINLLQPRTETRALNGDIFHIDRVVEWVSDSNSPMKCGASPTSEKIRFKRVNVTVTWDGMRAGASPVRADTVVSPNERVNDPNRGTMLISVLKSDGTGASGVAVTATPSLTTAPSPTDTQGCTFALKVAPNTYTVKLSKAGYVDETNDPNPIKTNVTITAGSTVSLPFQYDLAATYSLTYPERSAPVNAEVSPTMPTSFINTYRTHLVTSGTTVKMHPDSAGYTIVVGDEIVCPAVNPGNWPDSDDGTLLSAPLPVYGSEPGGLVSATVPTATVPLTGFSGKKIIAVSATGAAGGDCSTSVAYTFPAVYSTNRTIGLPYGKWNIYRGSVSSGNLVQTETLDPRTVAP